MDGWVFFTLFHEKEYVTFRLYLQNLPKKYNTNDCTQNQNPFCIG